MKKTMSQVQIKDAAKGQVEALFARLDVIDKDGDVTVKGAFTEGASCVISAYGHKSWEGALPVGKGTIHEVGDTAVFRGQFFLNTTHGRDTFETVKQLSEDGLQEWSYSLHDVEAEPAVVDGRKVRVLKRIGLVKEVSPVLRGAGVDTTTLSIKAAKQLASSLLALLREAGRARWADADWVWVEDYDPDAGWVVFAVESYDDDTDTYSARLVQVDYTATDTAVTLADGETDVHPTTTFLPKGSKFAEHTAATLRGVKELVEMATERLALRAAEGKSISEQLSAYDGLVAELAPLKAAIDQATPHTPTADVLEREFARFVAISQGVLS